MISKVKMFLRCQEYTHKVPAHFLECHQQFESIHSTCTREVFSFYSQALNIVRPLGSQRPQNPPCSANSLGTFVAEPSEMHPYDHRPRI